MNSSRGASALNQGAARHDPAAAIMLELHKRDPLGGRDDSAKLVEEDIKELALVGEVTALTTRRNSLATPSALSFQGWPEWARMCRLENSPPCSQIRVSAPMGRARGARRESIVLVVVAAMATWLSRRSSKTACGHLLAAAMRTASPQLAPKASATLLDKCMPHKATNCCWGVSLPRSEPRHVVVPSKWVAMATRAQQAPASEKDPSA